MDNTPIGNIVRTVKTVSPEDPIGRAAGVLRLAGLAELPVVRNGRVIGLVTEAAILDALATGDPATAAHEPVSTIFSDGMVYANRHMSVGQVALIMNEFGRQVLPVVTEFSGYLGVVTRSDVTSALALSVRPPVVAGLATPLGVHLTTGQVASGAGNLGLFLTGVLIMLMNYFSMAAVYGTAILVDKINLLGPWSLLAILHSTPIGAPNWIDTVRIVMMGMGILFFFILLRALPLSGYHAAEHQVVHAIENGEPLTPSSVKAMPRVHPRCGTNIVAAVILFLMVADLFSNQVAALIALFILVFAWRTIGSYFQYYVTTKPPNDKQIASGIKAGEELIEMYRKNPGYRVTGMRRIWNTGMPQVMMGVTVVMLLEQFVGRMVPGLF